MGRKPHVCLLDTLHSNICFVRKKFFIESVRLWIIPFAMIQDAQQRCWTQLLKELFSETVPVTVTREILFQGFFASHFLGYASMDGVSACSPLAVVEVAKAFHWFCIWKPHKVNVSLIYTFRSSHCRILCLVNVYINYEKSWYKWLYSFIHVACVAPNNNSVVMKLNKTSLGFFKRHPLAGVFHCPSTFWKLLVDNYGNNLPRSKNNDGNSGEPSHNNNQQIYQNLRS